MRRRVIRFLCLLVIILGLAGSTGDFPTPDLLSLPSVDLLETGSKSEISVAEKVVNDGALKLPPVVFKNYELKGSGGVGGGAVQQATLPPKFKLVTHMEGTVDFVKSDSQRVLWSLSTGSAIYSSYQAPLDEIQDGEYGTSRTYVDCGQYWHLYEYSRWGKPLQKLPWIDEYIGMTPIHKNGSVIVGVTETVVLKVDPTTGRVINDFKAEKSYGENKKIILDSGSVSQSNVKSHLYITRKDYRLQSFDSNSGELLWKLAIAEIDAELDCNDHETYGGVMEYGRGSGFRSRLDDPMTCRIRAPVYYPIVTRNSRCTSAQGLSSDTHELVVFSSSESKSKPSQVVLSNTESDLMLPQVKITGFEANNELFILRQINHKREHSSSTTSTNEHPLQLSGEIQSTTTPTGNDDGKHLIALSISSIVVIWILAVCYRKRKDQYEMKTITFDAKVSVKKKKVRKSVKNYAIIEKDKLASPGSEEEGSTYVESESILMLHFNKPIGGNASWQRVGKLFISYKEIGKGSNGTVVFEGTYEGRPVAVKRLVQAHQDAALKEIQNLIASDQHPNIVRWYGVEYDKDFVYLSLERCTCSLDDLIQIFSDCSRNSLFNQEESSRSLIEYKVRLDSAKVLVQDCSLWRENGYPSPLLLQLMRDVVSGVAHLHELGIVHRDLKPQNVLIIRDKYLRAKLSDMGISKQLIGNMSALDHHGTGCGSSGWQAPEQLLKGRQTLAVDLFSLGCVLFFCITGGRHPYGDRLERDINIVKNKADLFLVDHIPDAMDLLLQLLNPDPVLRPKALDVLHHPLFWTTELRLSFLRDTSDRVELEDREEESALLKALESTSSVALGVKWDEKLEQCFLANIGRYRRYKFDSVRDLLRVIRNKLNHYRELPLEIQELLGSVPDGFYYYFDSRFPKLLIEVYKIIRQYCFEEECFQKYFMG